MSDTIVIDGEVELLNVIDGDPDVFIGGGGSQPTGTKSILLTEAGTKTEDVTDYAYAEINAVTSATASGAIASFSDGAEDVPMTSCLVNIEPVQSGSGDPSPSNVRPISGWSEVNVYVSPTQSEQDATEYSVSLGQTVYGGTLDVVSGVLTVDRVKATKPSCGSVLSQTYPAVILSVSSVGAGVNQTANSKLIANVAPTVAPNSQYTSSMLAVALNSSKQLRLSVPGLTTKEEYLDWIDTNNFEVVYPLDTPTTVQLTPTEVKTLLGSNSVWADSGDIAVGYKADIFLYAESLETIIDTLTGGA